MMTNQDSTRPATGGPPVAQQRSADWAHRLHDPVVGRVPAIDFERAGGVDLDRLERSLQLNSKRVDHGRYHVTGGSSDHWVDLYSTSHPRCDCGDHLWRERICKHILAALLREGNERVVSALGALFTRIKTAA
ncbi:MAG TPA: SWIM zinc finger family protein [Gemmatimonadaceae bacterium]|nr:SWIM zinc finger family protein [Gemmatimonadaceae bacterium]